MTTTSPRRSSLPTRSPAPARRTRSAAAFVAALLLAVPATAQQAPPLRQSAGRTGDVPVDELTLRDASRDDRWLGLPPRDIRWAPDGSVVYFRWREDPEPGQDDDADPWYRADRAAQRVERVPDDERIRIPGDDPSWSRDGRIAAWATDGALVVYQASAPAPNRVKVVARLAEPARDVVARADGSAVHFTAGQDLFAYDVRTGLLRQLTRAHTLQQARPTEASAWLEAQQTELFELHRRARERREAADAREREQALLPPQPLPVGTEDRIDDVSVSPRGDWVVFRVRTPARRAPRTQYVDFVDETGYAAVDQARPKVGEEQDRVRMGIVRVDPSVPPDSVDVTWVELAEAGDEPVIPWGPWWSPEGDRALVAFMAGDHEDVWIGELDPATGTVIVRVHDHDDAWLGGPPVQANGFRPPLIEWLSGGRFVFASERTGWSHLYLSEPNGDVRPLTSGEWEVREAALSRDRSRWLLMTSREHPSEDHLYLMPAAGGELTRLTTRPGRNQGRLSPDGSRLAVLSSDAVSLPDLWLRDARPGADGTRITVSGTEAYARHPLSEPEVVSFPHPQDGRPLWAGLHRPERPNGAAILHIHGGGYRQFAHRGWTVYGWGTHLGLLNWLVDQGYTVLDFDYRGSAGYGRDYRTDIADNMGDKDVTGGVAAAKWLVENEGIDPDRIGVYGISYGGFFTLMALFRHPGVFAAGIANAAVSDWAHYNHGWTSRILGVPYEDPDAYRRSSPIYYASGLEDPLLIVHGLIDDNVHFQDAARVIQRLIEEEKPFEVMVYPTERHTIQSEDSRYDYVKRAAGFFAEHLGEGR